MHNNLAEGWNGWDRFYGIFLLVSAKTWYDANGNLVYVYTSRTKKDGMADEKIAERKLKWDEENRLLASAAMTAAWRLRRHGLWQGQ